MQVIIKKWLKKEGKETPLCFACHSDQSTFLGGVGLGLDCVRHHCIQRRWILCVRFRESCDGSSRDEVTLFRPCKHSNIWGSAFSLNCFINNLFGTICLSLTTFFQWCYLIHLFILLSAYTVLVLKAHIKYVLFSLKIFWLTILPDGNLIGPVLVCSSCNYPLVIYL